MPTCTPFGTLTPNIGLCKPAAGETPWWAAINANWDNIDSRLSGIAAVALQVAPGNSGTVNRQIIQAAHDALPVAGGILWQTQYGIHIDAAINISKPVTYLGPGITEVSTPGPFALILDTANQGAFNVTAKGPFTLRDLSVKCPGVAVSGAAVVVNGPTGTYKGTESVLIDHCVFYGGWQHLDFQAAIFQRVTKTLFINYGSVGARFRNLLDGDQGDGVIDGDCIFLSPTGANKFGVLYNSGGGLKIIGCKFLGNYAGIAVDPTSTATDPATLSDLVIANCSIENYSGYGVYLTRSAGTLAPSNIHLVNLQIAVNFGGGSVGIGIVPAAGTAYDRIVASGNMIIAPIAYQLRGTTNMEVDGGQVDAATSVLDVDSSVVNFTWGGRIISMGAFLAGTPGTGFLTLPGTRLTVAQLPAAAVTGAQAFATNAVGPGDGGYTGYGMTATAGGTGAPVFKQGATWKA